MAYVKTQWANGDVISAEKLNNIENGISVIDGNTVVYEIPVIYTKISDSDIPVIGRIDTSDNQMYIDVTVQDVLTNLRQGKNVYFRFNVDFSLLIEDDYITFDEGVTNISFMLPVYLVIHESDTGTGMEIFGVQIECGEFFDHKLFPAIYPESIFNLNAMGFAFTSQEVNTEMFVDLSDASTQVFNTFGGSSSDGGNMQ